MARLGTVASMAVCALACISISCGNGRRHTGLYVDSALEAELKQIPAIDNHAHPEKMVANGEEDRDSDALPPDAVQDLAMPSSLDNNPSYRQASHALFGYSFEDAKPEHLAQLAQRKWTEKKKRGDLYPAWVLNRSNTELMLANRVAMGRGLAADRFKWVPFADMFLFPLNNDAIKVKDPEHRAFIAREEALLKKYLADSQQRRLPGSLDEYLTFVSHELESWRASGAVAVKFELAYLRDLQISNPPRESAERVYSIYAQSSEPSTDEYKILQDYLFRHIAREAGRLGMPVHIHSSIGAGSYFREANASPLAMEPLFNDPALRRTKFVMLHGAWPFSREAAALILKPNVYLDFSGFVYMTYPREGARAIRQYLEAAPGKVLYGSDASTLSSSVGWEEMAWVGSNEGRLMLGLALTGMVEDGEIGMERAQQIGRMVLRDNARRLYRF